MTKILEELEKQYERNLNEKGPTWDKIDPKTSEWYWNENDSMAASESDIDWPEDPAALAAEWGQQ